MDWQLMVLYSAIVAACLALIFVYQKREGVAGYSPEKLIQRISDFHEIVDAVKKQKCICGGKLECDSVDLGGETNIQLHCVVCKSVIKWAVGKGLARQWQLHTEKQHPGELTETVETVESAKGVKVEQ